MLRRQQVYKTSTIGTNNVLYRPVTTVPQNGIFQLEKLAPQLFSQVAGGPGWGRNLGRKFAEIVPTISLTEAINHLKSDFPQETYIFEAIRGLLTALVPAYHMPPGAYFYIVPRKVEYRTETFAVETNLDFEHINRLFREMTHQSDAEINASTLLIYLLEARTDLLVASRFDSEIATHEVIYKILNVKFTEIIKNSQDSQGQIEHFQKMLLATGSDIAEAINMTYCTWTQMIELLHKAWKFKSWLKEKDINASLIQEYNKAVNSQTWAEKLGTKVLRFALVSGVGLGATVPGLILSAFDSFLFEKLVGGWKPNQFIDSSLKQFLRLD